ncbi:MAG TPA: hypothetical protein PK431_12215 [Chitinophagales bacterium]|nr:hypothetical protein [Chitinophagales bacterium]
MRKTIVLSVFIFVATVFCSKAQTLTTKSFFKTNDNSTSFDFKSASASILTKENALMNSYNYGSGTKNKAYLEQKVKKYHKMKIAGIVLASLGGAALVGTIAGSVVLGRRTNLYTDEDGSNFLRTYGMAVGGTFLTAALLGPGIPLAIIGSKKEKRYKAQLAQK